MAELPAGEFWFLDDPQWQAWLDAFPVYTLLDARHFSGWRRRIESAARHQMPGTPLSTRDKVLILNALTQFSDRLKDNASAAVGTTIMLAGAAAVSAIAMLLFPPLVPVTAVLGALAGAKRAWDTGLGSSAGNRAVSDLLTDIAGTLP